MSADVAVVIASLLIFALGFAIGAAFQSWLTDRD